ncbi:MAG: alpha/beta fold hydrolase [Moraxellaceae bacterium]
MSGQMTPLAHEWHDGPAPDAPVLVLLHGWSMDRRAWAPLLPWLTPHCRVLAIDLPGHGGADWRAQEADFAVMCERVLAVAPPEALWLGWSLGGLVALQISAQQPARVQALTLLAATPCFVARDDGFPAMPAATFAAFADRLATTPERTLARFRQLLTAGAANVRTLRERLAALDATARPPQPAALAAGLAWLRDIDLRGALASLRPPAQLLLADNDALVPSALADWCARELPHVAVLRLPAAGHAVHLEQPKRVAEAYLAHWQRHVRRSPLAALGPVVATARGASSP